MAKRCRKRYRGSSAGARAESARWPAKIMYIRVLRTDSGWEVVTPRILKNPDKGFSYQKASGTVLIGALSKTEKRVGTTAQQQIEESSAVTETLFVDVIGPEAPLITPHTW